MVRAWRKSTSLARLCCRPFSVAAAGSATGIAAKSVHPTGISAAAVGEHNQQQCYATAAHGAQRLQNAALEGMPLAQDCYRTWKVAEMGSVWWCSSGAFRMPTC